MNVKQRSCEYQLLKSFGLTRQGFEPGLPTTKRTLYKSLNHAPVKELIFRLAANVIIPTSYMPSLFTAVVVESVVICNCC